MKKMLLKTVVVVSLLGTFSVPALACPIEPPLVNEARADVKYWVHDYFNGVRMHKLWNQTQNQYETLWMICDC